MAINKYVYCDVCRYKQVVPVEEQDGDGVVNLGQVLSDVDPEQPEAADSEGELETRHPCLAPSSQLGMFYLCFQGCPVKGHFCKYE